MVELSAPGGMGERKRRFASKGGGIRSTDGNGSQLPVPEAELQKTGGKKRSSPIARP